MSREFGDNGGSYFHHKIEDAKHDALGGKYEITRLVGELLRPLSEIAYAISTAEAYDSGQDYPIRETIKQLPKLQEMVRRLYDYCEPFEEVSKQAIIEYLEEAEQSTKTAPPAQECERCDSADQTS